jgi:hypothetical protein
VDQVYRRHVTESPPDAVLLFQEGNPKPLRNVPVRCINLPIHEYIVHNIIIQPDLPAELPSRTSSDVSRKKSRRQHILTVAVEDWISGGIVRASHRAGAVVPL